MKNLQKLFAPLALVLAFVVLFSSCKSDDPVVVAPKDITVVATENGSFKTLVAALTKAELVTTLKGTGPFTVFAPNDAAFTKAGITSLDPLTKAALTPILTTHVLSGAAVKAADVKSGAVNTVNTANQIYLSKNADGVFINGKIRVIATDVVASNGVIHVIDDVIEIPKSNLVTIASGNTDFSELVSLVGAADASVGAALTNASAKGLTVFAPTNAAFQELYKGVGTSKAALIANKTLLTKVLLYHVVPDRVFSTDLPNVGTTEVMSANGVDKLSFDLVGGAKVKGKTSGNSTITTANILATNGVIHIINKVLIP